MSAQIFYNNGSSSSEIITHLVNASDGAGLHFNGTSGTIDIATPPDLGTKFSFEFIIQADSIPASGYAYLADFGNGGRFALTVINEELAIYDTGERKFSGATFLSDLKVHHVVVTVDGTAAIAYDNGNQVGTLTIAASNINSCTDAKIGSRFDGTPFFNGTIYRARFWNKTLSSADVTSVYESASIDFADQWGSQTELSTNTFVDAGFAGFSGNAGGFTTSGSSSGSKAYKNQTFTGGKKYRLKFTISDGNSADLDLNFRTAAAGAGVNAGKIESSNLGTIVSDTYLELSATGNYELILSDLGSVESIRIYSGADVGAVNISAFSVVEIGCVADFDFSYANPTQSTIVQNRNDTVSMDGTAAGGVSQITKLEAVNTNKLNVGGTTPLVGIGLAAGTEPSSTLHVNSGGDNDAATFESTDTEVYLHLKDSTGSAYLKSRGDFRFECGGGDRLTIDSAGNSTFTQTGSDQSGKAAVKAIGTAYGTNKALHAYINTANATRSLLYVENSGGAVLDINGAGLATFNNGIAFNQNGTTATGASTASSTLQHYETGTWTPILKSGSTTITLSGGNQSATYTRIGNMVTVQWSFRDVTTAGSFENAATKIHGLPFTAGSAKLSQGSVFSIYGGTSFSASPDFTRVDVGTVIVDVMHQAAAAYSSPEIDAVGAGTYGGFTMTYWV